MTVEAVVFDWGGTLTPHHTVDLLDLWRAAARVLAPDRVEEVATALAAAERRWWERRRRERAQRDDGGAAGRGGARHRPRRRCGRARRGPRGAPGRLDPAHHHRSGGGPAADGAARARHPDRAAVEHALAAPLARALARTRRRARPHRRPRLHLRPAAHQAASGSVPGGARRTRRRAADRSVFVGDRPVDDISGAKGVGMRAVLVENSDVPGHPVVPDARINRLIAGITPGRPMALRNRMRSTCASALAADGAEQAAWADMTRLRDSRRR